MSLLSNRTLYDMPVAVCGSVEARHGIILAKNEIAKAAGVKTAEALWEARLKCPDLVTLAPDYKKYSEYSKKAHAIYERYTDLIEPFGIDECWLDVTGSTLLFGTGEQIADRIRRDIRTELGITASVGVSFNKVFAKLGSDMKKPDATTVISKENFKEKVWPLAASELLFVGKSTAERLRRCGIITVGDITECDDKTLLRMLGKNGAQLKKYALGLDDSPVTPPREDEIPKSIGKSTTLPHDITTREEVWETFLSLSEQIADSMRRKGVYASVITVHTRDTALKVKETSRTLALPVCTAMGIAKEGMKIFDETYRFHLPLRSVGLRTGGFKTENVAFQQDMFGTAEFDAREEKIENSVNLVRDRFGRDSVKRGRIIENPDGRKH